jgi:hypothetical protein
LKPAQAIDDTLPNRLVLSSGRNNAVGIAPSQVDKEASLLALRKSSRPAPVDSFDAAISL